MTTKRKAVRVSQKKISTRAPIQKVDYEKDFFVWTKNQASLLKKGRLEDLDVENLIEEIESLVVSQRKAIKSYCVVLLTHLLKQRHQPEENCNSWKCSIANARMEINLLFEYSPSLKKELDKVFVSAYEGAKRIASYETNIPLNKFEKNCPWTVKQAIDLEPKSRQKKNAI